MVLQVEYKQGLTTGSGTYFIEVDTLCGHANNGEPVIEYTRDADIPGHGDLRRYIRVADVDRALLRILGGVVIVVDDGALRI